MDKQLMEIIIRGKAKKLGIDDNMINQMLYPNAGAGNTQDQGAMPSTDQMSDPVIQRQIQQETRQQTLREQEAQSLVDAVAGGYITPEAAASKNPLVGGLLKTKGIKPTSAKTSIEKPKSAESQKIEGLGKSGVEAIRDVRKIYNEDPSVLSKQLIPGHFLSRKFDAAMYNAADTLLRLRTGAQANPSEIRGYMERIGPSFGDSPQDVEYKLSQMEKALVNSTGVAPVASEKISNKQDFFGGLLGNATKDVGNILNGILNIPKNVMESNAQNMQEGKMPLNVSNLPYELLKGYAGELNQAAGEPFKGGDVVGRIGKRAYEKPVTTALDILPFLKLKGRGATVSSESSPIQADGAIQKIMNIPKKAGEGMVENVRKIDVGASPYGPTREAQIGKTLDELNIKGSPAQQYSQLQPKISQLGKEIKTYLDTNAKPINATNLKKTFIKNITSELPEETMAVPSVEREASSFVKQISGKEASKLTTSDLFDIKQKINASYSRISSKLDRGLPLTDKEKVVYVARKTIDDIITSEHPSIKQATLKQSNLYEASKSLYKQRSNAPMLKALGIQIPLPDLRGPQDALGRFLRGK